MEEVEIGEIVNEDLFIELSNDFIELRNEILDNEDKVIDMKPFSKIITHFKLGLEDIRVYKSIYDELGYEYDLNKVGDSTISTSILNHFYVTLILKIGENSFVGLCEYLKEEIKENKIEFIMSFMLHIKGFDMCYVGFDSGYFFIPYNDYLKNLLEGNMTFLHAFIRFQDVVHFPGVDNPIKDIITSIYDEESKSVSLKKKGGKVSMLEIDLEYLENEMKFIDIAKKHPHSDISAKSYGGKIQKYLVKEKKKFDLKEGDV